MPVNPQVFDFNPRSPRGERLDSKSYKFLHLKFQPSLPARGATPLRQPKVPVKRFQPSLPARGATLSHCDSYGLRQISTLAPREGSDFAARLLRYRQRHFNPRSPRGERQAVKRVQNFLHRFQPSLPARGATTRSGRSRARRRFQPSLPARGATQDGRESGTILSISTLAPREGSDRFPVSFHPRLPTFQPSLPARGATCRFDSRAVDCFLFQPSLPARGATCRRTAATGRQ